MSDYNKITTERDIFGNLHHYNEFGAKVGESWQSPFGTTEHYDSVGNKTGSSFTNAFGESVHYDSSGHKIGTSQNSIFGTDHYDNTGRKIGRTDNTGVASMESEFNHSGGYISTPSAGGHCAKRRTTNEWATLPFKTWIFRVLILGVWWLTTTLGFINVGMLLTLGLCDWLGIIICVPMSVMLFLYIRSWRKKNRKS